MHMQRIITLIAIALASATFTSAATVKIKVADLSTVANALAALDGYIKETPNGTIRAPYEFTGVVRWYIGTNVRAIKEQIAIANERKDALVKQLSGGGNRLVDKDGKVIPGLEAAHEQFTKEFAEVLAARVDVEVVLLKIDQLNLDKNAIPPTVLADLGPILQP